MCDGMCWSDMGINTNFSLHGVGFARFLAGVAMVVTMHYIALKTVAIKLPSRMLLESIALDLGLLLFITVGRWLFGSAQSLWAAGGLITIISLAYLPIFYWFISPFIKGRSIE